MKERIIRKLARSRKWMLLYARSKEISGIKLFENEIDFTTLQILFLQYLELYNSLFIDLALKEENISIWVIDDDIRCDAYLYWKGVQRDKERDNIQSNIPRKQKSGERIIFTSPKKRS
jgi:hypothetical protein